MRTPNSGLNGAMANYLGLQTAKPMARWIFSRWSYTSWDISGGLDILTTRGLWLKAWNQACVGFLQKVQPDMLPRFSGDMECREENIIEPSGALKANE